MNIKNKVGPALVLSAILGGIATQATVASAFMRCRGQWPVTFTQCQSTSAPVGHATGRGSTSGGLHTVVANRVSGGFAQAGALNSAGGAIAGCQVEDQTINGVAASFTCPAGTPTPAFLFLTSL